MPPWVAKSAKPEAPRYDLATALRIVRRMETSAGRGAVFTEIKAKNSLYRWVDRAYSQGGARIVQPLLLFAYMVKSALCVGPLGVGDAQAVSISQFGNEHHAIDRLASLVPSARIHRLSLKRRHVLGRGQMRAAATMLGLILRLWPFLSRLARTHSFMPAGRIASTLAFYMRFIQLFADHPKLRAGIVASNYSPEALGLAAAAHQLGRKVVYINHAPVPANGPLVPPVLADCALFYGDAVRRTYERRSRCVAEVALIGQPWRARPMRWPEDIGTIGIFLTALTKPETVGELVGALRSTHPDARILVRNHPVALLRDDFADLVSRHENLSVTHGTPLDDEIAACDLVICGNSGVAMNAVSGGCPVAYVDSLDGSAFDHNGFVESGLICHVPTWNRGTYGRLRAFYERPGWRAVMGSYDASYEADPARLQQVAGTMILRHLDGGD